MTGATPSVYHVRDQLYGNCRIRVYYTSISDQVSLSRGNPLFAKPAYQTLRCHWK
jgi:hypothetical protein